MQREANAKTASILWRAGSDKAALDSMHDSAMDFSTMVIHLAKDLLAAQALIQTIAVGIGIGYCASAVMQSIKKSASPGADIASVKKIFTSFLIGVLMINFAETMSNVWASLTGEQQISYGMVPYFDESNESGAGVGVLGRAINAILTIISTFGWFYGFKGWILLRKAASNRGGYEDDGWRGLMHILGGAAMINITDTLDAFKETVGLAF